MKVFLICGKGNAVQYAIQHSAEILAPEFKIVHIYKPNELEVSSLTGMNNVEFAQKHSIECHAVHSQCELYETVLELKPEYIFLAQFSIIIRSEILELHQNKIINLHYGKLPEYRGVAPVTQSILNNEDECGVTLHYVDSGIDTGDVIKDEIFEITSLTNEEAYRKCEESGASLIEWLYNKIKHKEKLPRIKQDVTKARYYSKGDVDYSNTKVNLNQKGQEIVSFCNAFLFPSKGLYPKLHLNNKKYVILESPYVYESELNNTGGNQVAEAAKAECLTVKCADCLIQFKVKEIG